MIKIEDLEVGTKVVIRDDLGKHHSYGGIWIDSGKKMSEYGGKVATIVKIYGGNRIDLDVDEGYWCWSPEMFSMICASDREKFDHVEGEVVKVICGEFDEKLVRIKQQCELLYNDVPTYKVEIEGKEVQILESHVIGIKFSEKRVDVTQALLMVQRGLVVKCVTNDEKTFYYKPDDEFDSLSMDKIMGKWYIQREVPTKEFLPFD